MKHRFFFASPFVVLGLGITAAEVAACNGSSAGPSAAEGGADTGSVVVVTPDAGGDEGGLPPIEASTSCTIAKGIDFIDFCFQKKVIEAEHAVFDPAAGIASSWSSSTGKPDMDGGGVAHSYKDDVAYAASLATYSISAQAYGDTELSGSIVAPDLTALAPIVEAELATLPATYEGELYMRLRRFAQGLNSLGAVPDGGGPGGAIDALADAYGRAIYTTYFHAIDAAATDAGSDAGDDAGPEAGAGDAGGADAGGADAGGDASVPLGPIGQGILGVAQSGGGYLYDVDQAASGALALVDMAGRHLADEPAQSLLWARAAGSIFNYLYARALHTSGLYYADLVTSADPDHDALANVVTPNDALLTETQAQVAASLLRASALATAYAIPALGNFPFGAQAQSVLNALGGREPDGGTGFDLWDPSANTAASQACATLPDPSACGGNGFFVRWLPSGAGLDNSAKTTRGNALMFAAIHRSFVPAPSVVGIDYEPLSALFESTAGISDTFITVLPNQTAYLDAVSAALEVIPTDSSYTAQANAYAIEALTEQWVGKTACPPEFH
jgi:hypothetical protein